MSRPAEDLPDRFYGTSLSGYLTATYDDLVEAFGEPTGGDGYKVQAEWRVMLDGHPVTVYDWKRGGDPKSCTEWNIGGNRHDEDVAAVEDALREATMASMYGRD